jgi:transposase
VEKKKRSHGYRYTLEFQLHAVERMKEAENISALAEELGVARQLLYLWRRQLGGKGSGEKGLTSAEAERNALQKQLREVKQLLAEKTLEVDFFKGALQKIEARRQKSEKTGGTASTNKSGR